MYVMINGTRQSAIDRLRSKGWRPAQLNVNGASIALMQKDHAVVGFHPTDDAFASLPCEREGGMFGVAFEPLPSDDPLYGEAMDCLCGTL